MRTDWVWCYKPKVGRRHSLACHLKCKESEKCSRLRDHEREQARLIEEIRESKVLPAFQHWLPKWRE